MNERELQDTLRDILEELMFARDDEDDPFADLAERTEGIRQIATYDDIGKITTDQGFVVECDDGTEFHVFIVQRKYREFTAVTASASVEADSPEMAPLERVDIFTFPKPRSHATMFATG